MVVHINQVNVAGDIQLARAELAHADHPQLCQLGFGAGRGNHQRRAVNLVERGACVGQGLVKRNFCQLGHRTGDNGQRSGLLAIQHHQPFHHQLPQYAQRCRQPQTLLLHVTQARQHRLPHRWAFGQAGQIGCVATAHALDHA